MLSAAFDTVCHRQLLRVLESRIGLVGTALQWFIFYLGSRTQSVKLRDVFTPASILAQGVPQGSVLGPALFSVYTLPLGDIVRRHGLQMHCYADDTQLYAAFKMDDNIPDITEKLEKCITSINTWMKANYLHLNDTKNEVICFASPRSSIDPGMYGVHVGESFIPPSASVRDL